MNEVASRAGRALALWRWPVRSQERAVANARVAATDLSRLRVQRAEVARYLDRYPGQYPDQYPDQDPGQDPGQDLDLNPAPGPATALPVPRRA